MRFFQIESALNKIINLRISSELLPFPPESPGKVTRKADPGRCLSGGCEMNAAGFSVTKGAGRIPGPLDAVHDIF